MPSNRRSTPPNAANARMTAAAVKAACDAARRRASSPSRSVTARKIGTLPTGSMITSRVTKTWANTIVSVVPAAPTGDAPYVEGASWRV